MTIQLANFLKNALEYDGKEAEIRERYSGRGMFGRETVGIVFSSPTILLESILTYIKENRGLRRKFQILIEFKEIIYLTILFIINCLENRKRYSNIKI